jgi:hypothetical protein
MQAYKGLLFLFMQATQFISNYKTFDFFDIKFDHSSYSKICAKYQFFYRGLVY